MSGPLLQLRKRPPAPGQCQVLINRIPCKEQAPSTWEGGCVHEHVTTDIHLCDEHRKLAERPFKCLPCEPDHVCMVQLQEAS